MTRKHFIALADALRSALLHSGDITDNEARAVIDALADFCATQSPRFDREGWVGYVLRKNGPHGGKPR